MTKEKIDDRIQKWAKDRGLDELEYNDWFAKASQLEEGAEELRARGNHDTHETIDALCDKYVYATVDLLKKNSNYEYLNDAIESVENTFKHEFGCDIYIALDETLKEIESRTGAWSNEHGKWKKFTTPEAKALWYKADYKSIIKNQIEIDRDRQIITDFIKLVESRKIDLIVSDDNDNWDTEFVELLEYKDILEFVVKIPDGLTIGRS